MIIDEREKTRKLLEYKLRLEKELNYRNALPHRYAHKLYKFQEEFLNNNTDRIQLLTACNQVGKSSIHIIKYLEWGFSSKEDRKRIWGANYNNNDKFVMFYLYPDEDTAIREFKSKWLKYLPKYELLSDDQERAKWTWSVNSGWSKNIEFLKEINTLHFPDGIIYFLTYGKNVLTLQGTTCYAVGTDEELPESLYPELQVRLRATEGFFTQVFTATRGELCWYRAMERIGKEDETFKDAWKKTVSLYDCQVYADGTPSMWNLARIKREEAKCLTQTEIDIRIHGRCIMNQDSLLIKHFSPDLVLQSFELPIDWELWCGIDIGSGGNNHKSAIAITAVPPNRKRAVVLEVWREDELPTTEDDVLRKYKEMIAKYPRKPITFYDWHAKDFETLVQNDPTVTMYKAEKSHEIGFGIMNTLMKAKRMHFVEGSHMNKLIAEMKRLKESDPKNKRLDDSLDSTRYSCSRIPFDTVDLQEKIALEQQQTNIIIEQKEVERRRNGDIVEEAKPATFWEEEFEDYNDLIRY